MECHLLRFLFSFLFQDDPSLAEHPLEECAVHAPTTFENDSGLDSAGSRPRVEPSEMPDGVAHRHSSPVQPDSSNVANLEQQLKVSQEMQQQLQYELNSLRENQFGAIEGAKREVTTNYESQLAALQQTLTQMEQRCIALENHLSETKTSHRAEIENLLRQQEMAMQERDQKHAAHIVRLTTELTNQQEISGVVGGDSDEHEAERLRMIKEKMKEMHEEEKKQVAVEHEREKVKIREECQQQMELRRQQMEQLANTKIQELHAQFMSAHQTVLDQKNSAEATVAHWKNQVEEVQQQLDAIKLEKSSTDAKHQSTIEAHCAEMKLANQQSQDLEKHLIEWREKAATLEARLEKLNLQRASDIDELQRQNQEAMQQTVADFEEKLKAQKSLIEEYQARVQFFESSQQATIDEIEHRHLQDIDELKAKHSSEVSLLEESISDSSGDRASLEVAEAHMKSLQSQLDAYRTQESNFQGKLERLEQQHREDIELLKQQLEAQNLEEVEQVSAKFAAQIESLEEELTKLQNLVEEDHSPSTDQEVIKTMEAKHQKEILELQTTLHNSHELELTNLRKELELSNSTALEALQQQHESTISAIRKELDTEWAARLTKAEKKVRDEAEHVKQAELERLKSEHKVALEKLRQSLAQTEERATAKTETRVTSLEAELQALRDEQSEWLQSRQDLLSQLEFTQRQLQETSQHLSHRNSEKLQLEEQCQRYQNEMKSVEVDLNIARNTSEQDKLALAEAQEQVEHWMAKASEFQGEIDRLDEVERVNAEQSHKVIELTDNIAQKNMTIADLQAQNDTLNTEVFSLTQKCQQHIVSAEMLRKQLESTGNADEQISSLQQQLSELIPIKEGYSRVQERAQSMESQLHAKDKELAMVRSQLEQMAQQVAETGEQWSARCEELTASSARETEALRKEIANHRAQESELRQQLKQYQQQIDTLKPKEQENTQTITDLNHTIQNLSGKLGLAESEIKQLRQEKHKLEQDLKDSQGILDELAGDEHDTELSKNYERLQQDFATSRAEKIQLAAELAKLQKEHQQVLQEQTKSWENKLREQEQLIQDLQAQLSAKESAFTEIQNEFGRQLTEVEMRESSLLKRVRDSTKAQEQLGTVLGEKSALEEVLSKARQNLTDKLQEKESLERELGFHRTELERRLAEKHRLEELLFEKSRFEQELQSQKDQLQKELKDIESKLKLKEIELEQQQQQHSSDLSQLQEDLVTRHSTELAQLSEGLNHQHDLHISTLTEDHRRQLTDVESNLRRKHNEAVHLLETKHKKEVI